AEMAAFRCGEGRLRDAYVQIARSWSALASELAAPANDHGSSPGLPGDDEVVHDSILPNPP
ncbi:MAG TPA: hypothetical protein VHT51_04450, partial [Micropepsaceae bacterium]|nr:hypothetical protein [Micropepsaceae bacterium]